MEENLLKASTHKKTIAAQAGVSIPTVSRVLNGRPDVALATRARIEQVIKESGMSGRVLLTEGVPHGIFFVRIPKSLS